MVSDLNYEDLQTVLAGLGTPVDAAEAHGFLCGGLCAYSGFGLAEWLAELLPDGAPPGMAVEAGTLTDLRQATVAALESEEFEFAPLVPGDDAALADRVGGLAAWCGGFLYALGASGEGSPAPLTGDLEEVLEDFAEITRAQLDPEEAGEASEAAWAELYEFVRAGTQLAYDELAGHRAGQPALAQQLH